MAKKGHEAETLIIDIRTASLGAALLSHGKDNLPSLKTISRLPIGSGTTVSRDALIQGTVEALKPLLAMYEKTSVSTIHVVISAPWYDAHIRTITSNSEKPAQISEKNIVRAVSRYQDEKPPETGNVDVEAVAVHVEVNGYGTALKNPIVGSRIDINLYESEMNVDIQKMLIGPIEKVFPNARISFNTFPLVSIVALRSIIPETSFTIVDISGEATQLAIAHGDGIRHFASFPVGFYTIARKGAEKDAVGDALSRFALLAREELSEDERASTQTKLDAAFAPWSEAFNEALKSASLHTPIPQGLYLVSDKEHTPWLKKGIEGNNVFHVNVVPVSAPTVQNFLRIDEEGWYDVFLSCEALFFHNAKKDLIGEKQESSNVSRNA